ncbi:MAG: hypothetical protein ACREQ5_17340, partial [Candidatus Dormibacteria bacterium]
MVQVARRARSLLVLLAFLNTPLLLATPALADANGDGTHAFVGAVESLIRLFVSASSKPAGGSTTKPAAHPTARHKLVRATKPAPSSGPRSAAHAPVALAPRPKAVPVAQATPVPAMSLGPARVQARAATPGPARAQTHAATRKTPIPSIAPDVARNATALRTPPPRSLPVAKASPPVQGCTRSILACSRAGAASPLPSAPAQDRPTGLPLPNATSADPLAL